MIKNHESRTDKVYKELASGGRYVNTGKVLIGVSYEPRLPQLTISEEVIQGALLGANKRRITTATIVHAVLLFIVFTTLFISCKP